MCLILITHLAPSAASRFPWSLPGLVARRSQSVWKVARDLLGTLCTNPERACVLFQVDRRPSEIVRGVLLISCICCDVWKWQTERVVKFAVRDRSAGFGRYITGMLFVTGYLPHPDWMVCCSLLHFSCGFAPLDRWMYVRMSLYLLPSGAFIHLTEGDTVRTRRQLWSWTENPFRQVEPKRLNFNAINVII